MPEPATAGTVTIPDYVGPEAVDRILRNVAMLTFALRLDESSKGRVQLALSMLLDEIIVDV